MPDQSRTLADDLPKAPGVKIIRAADESAWRDAYRFLADARKIYESERARGFAEGMAAAHQEAGRLIVDTAAKVDGYLASMEKQIARLSFDIIRRVLSEFDDAELVARAARNALADFRDAKEVRIKIHPSAEAKLQRMLIERAAGRQPSPAVAIEADADLDATNCILSTEFAVIDATIDTQLAAIAEAMGLDPGKAAE